MAVGLVFLPVAAFASHLPLQDPNDTSGHLDLRRIEITTGSRWVVTTWPEWSARRIHDRGYVLIWFDTFGGGAPDYYALISSTGRRMAGSLFRYRRGRDDRRVAGIRVSRPDRSSVAGRIPLGAMRFDLPPTFEWYVQSLMTSRACPRVCIDRAPDEGRVLEPGPAPTPTPTPSPSPTETPRARPAP